MRTPLLVQFFAAPACVGCASLALISIALPASAQTKLISTPLADASPQASDGSVPGQPTAPSQTTATKLAGLPAPFPPGLIQGIDTQTEGRLIRVHLSEVIRYFRMAVSPVQKVGEPSDVLYAQQMQGEAVRIGQLAFQAARGQASFFARIPSAKGVIAGQESAEAGKVNDRLRAVAAKISDFEAQDTTLEQQIRTAKPARRGALKDQKGDVEGQLKLYTAILSALQKVVTSSTGGAAGLQGEINQLQHSAPELVSANYKPIAGTVESIGSFRDAGVSNQTTILFQLIAAGNAIEQRARELHVIEEQAEALRQPLSKVLVSTLAATQGIQEDTGSSPAELAAKSKRYSDLTSAFTTLSDVAIPLSQEILAVEQAEGTLLSWRASVDAEKSSILHALLLRIAGIALALGIILGLGAVWRQAATRYVKDVRRRRQILLIRRLTVGFLGGLVLVLGFVTQFSSLATFAGFITAGIAVGLQTILLSVAAYFFIVGRYGIRVGDRVTVAGVTGEVVEVGLVRFYLLELTGSGTELHPTGRVAVFANSVLFQTGTPLYKQLPGTGYAWHEIALNLKPAADYGPALDVIRAIVADIYAGYRQEIETQHRQVEGWIDTAIKAPRVETRLQLTDGMQYVVLYPVKLEKASETDEIIVQKIMGALKTNQTISQAVEGTPVVRAVVKT